MSTPFATGGHNRGWLPDPPPHVMVRCFVSLDAVSDLAQRHRAVTSYLQRVAAQLAPVASAKREWSLSELTYVATPVPRDPLRIFIWHPLSGARATEENVEELAARLVAAADEIDGSWAMVAWADVIWGRLLP